MVSQPLYGCLSCGVQSVFDADQQKEHYKSEWHRYNLRRKINGLPCVTKEAFEEKLAAASGAARQAVQAQHETFNCSKCNKQFASKNSYENHLKSLKHSQMEQVLTEERPHVTEDKMPTKFVADDDNAPDEDETASNASWETLSEEDLTDDELSTWSPRCFICRWPRPPGPLIQNYVPKKVQTVDTLIAHLAREHGFYLPQPELVKDLKSLLCHLSCRVVMRCECLYCPMRFSSTRAAQQHMIDKGHTKLFHEMPDDSRPQQSRRRRYASDDYTDDETDDYEVELPRHFKYYDFRNHQPAGPVFDDDGWSLLLPNGHTAGHRDLQRYYKQHLRAVPQGFHCPANVARLGFASAEEKRRTVLHVVTQHQQSKQLLLHNGSGRLVLTPLEKTDQRLRLKRFRQRQLRLGMNNNRLMHHFRTQHGMGWGE